MLEVISWLTNWARCYTHKQLKLFELLNVAERLCQQTLSLSLIHQVWWWSIEKKTS